MDFPIITDYSSKMHFVSIWTNYEYFTKVRDKKLEHHVLLFSSLVLDTFLSTLVHLDYNRVWISFGR